MQQCLRLSLHKLGCIQSDFSPWPSRMLHCFGSRPLPRTTAPRWCSCKHGFYHFVQHLLQLCQFPACWAIPPAVRGCSASPVGESCPVAQATQKNREILHGSTADGAWLLCFPRWCGLPFSCGIAVACVACELFGRRCAVAVASPIGAGRLGTASSLREAERLRRV